MAMKGSHVLIARMHEMRECLPACLPQIRKDLPASQVPCCWRDGWVEGWMGGVIGCLFLSLSEHLPRDLVNT